MPKNKFQEVIFTIMMVLVMVYAMIVYNISLSLGGLENKVFLLAFKELVIMGPIAFIIDMFLVSKIAGKKARNIVDIKKDNPFLMVLMISCISILLMCPIMSLVATILFKSIDAQFISVWIQTVCFNFPMALIWQLFFAGPFVRFIFNKIFN